MPCVTAAVLAFLHHESRPFRSIMENIIIYLAANTTLPSQHELIVNCSPTGDAHSEDMNCRLSI